MRLNVMRYSECYLFGGSTFGLLFIEGAFGCYVLEDEGREVKVPGETRIPAGEYRVIMRTWGSMNDRYAARFPNIHKGMLEIARVPNFTDILIHCGNTEKDTAGCLLVGDMANNNQVEQAFLGESTQAYARIYKVISEAVIDGKTVTLSIG
jgi:hypothetical protein